MGALKHLIIPFYTFLHVLGCYQAMNPTGFVSFCVFDEVDSGSDEPMSLREKHWIGTIAAFHLGLAVLCFMGFYHESAHFRGILVTFELIFYGARALNAHLLGLPAKVYSKPAIAAVIALIGGILHLMEPGLFTKDKTQKLMKKLS